jgi:DNA-binding Lrp family transcriptional regulator
MDLSQGDRLLIAAIQDGLPLHPQPYAEIGRRIGMHETQVIARLQALQENGVIKRLGVIVRHHELGYRANAMVVWDVPDEQVSSLGRCLGGFDFVTLCYRRPRRLPDWPYNLFCMLHGRDREAVLDNVALLVERCGLQHLAYKVLFSRRRYKQRGARYLTPAEVPAAPPAAVGAP